jgi:hypothetical protein
MGFPHPDPEQRIHPGLADIEHQQDTRDDRKRADLPEESRDNLLGERVIEVAFTYSIVIARGRLRQ